MTEIYAFINRKGGSAKTTSAINVAALLAMLLKSLGKKVLLVDLDSQGHVAVSLGVNPGGRCISYLLTGAAPFDEIVVSADRSATGGPSRPNLDILPSSSRLSQTTIQLVASEVAARISGSRGGPTLDNILGYWINEEILSRYEFVIVDCPPTLGTLDQTTYGFVKKVVTPVKMAFLDTTGARQHLEDIREAQLNGAKAQLFMVLPTFYRSNEVLARQVITRLYKVYGKRLAKPVPQSVLVEKSQAAGQLTLFEYAPESPPAQSYMWLVQQMLKASPSYAWLGQQLEQKMQERS